MSNSASAHCARRRLNTCTETPVIRPISCAAAATRGIGSGVRPEAASAALTTPMAGGGGARPMHSRRKAMRVVIGNERHLGPVEGAEGGPLGSAAENILHHHSLRRRETDADLIPDLSQGKAALRIERERRQ